MRATKQDPASPSRCLSHFDFAYVKNKYFSTRGSMRRGERQCVEVSHSWGRHRRATYCAPERLRRILELVWEVLAGDPFPAPYHASMAIGVCGDELLLLNMCAGLECMVGVGGLDEWVGVSG